MDKTFKGVDEKLLTVSIYIKFEMGSSPCNKQLAVVISLKYTKTSCTAFFWWHGWNSTTWMFTPWKLLTWSNSVISQGSCHNRHTYSQVCQITGNHFNKDFRGNQWNLCFPLYHSDNCKKGLLLVQSGRLHFKIYSFLSPKWHLKDNCSHPNLSKCTLVRYSISCLAL